jgi:protocatechuate 3,4-dioxygenase beta subunit
MAVETMPDSYHATDISNPPCGVETQPDCRAPPYLRTEMRLKNQMLSFFFVTLLIATPKGSLHGTVTDPSGAVVPKAAVTVSGDHFSRTVLTDESGRYTIASLQPGRYIVHVSAPGFATYDRSGLIVSSQRDTEGDAPLEIGKSRQQITVSLRDPSESVSR